MPYHILTPVCHGLSELPLANAERHRVQESGLANLRPGASDPLTIHLSHGLAYTVGSALGSIPPSADSCLDAFVTPSQVGLTAGARAWTKHAHRSYGSDSYQDTSPEEKKRRKQEPAGWWGRPSGPVKDLNERALVLFWKIMDHATWKNLHWLPHQILVYEVRVTEGYGMRWSQDRGNHGLENEDGEVDGRPWIFRGFVEPMMEDGHEKGWRH